MIKDFEYLAPKTVAEAIELASRYKDEAKIIAGGQSLLVVMKQGLLDTEYLIDIKNLSELNYIKYSKAEGLRIGALTIHRDLEMSSVIKKHCKVISEMEDNLAVIQTRNWGTIGGNLCHADPAGDPAIVFIVLNATLKLINKKGQRTLNMESFSHDYLETVLKPDELLSEIVIPPIPDNTGVAHQKLMVQKGDMGIVGVAVSITINPSSHKCEDSRIAISNASSVPVRAKETENYLKGKLINEPALVEAGEIAAKFTDPPTDVHATAAYRKEMIKVFIKRAGKLAVQRAIKN